MLTPIPKYSRICHMQQRRSNLHINNCEYLVNIISPVYLYILLMSSKIILFHALIALCINVITDISPRLDSDKQTTQSVIAM